MSGCGCGGGHGSGPIGVYDFNAVQGLAELEQTFISADLRQAKDAERVLWAVGNSLGVAVGIRDGREGCGILPILGLPVKVCWKFDGDIVPPKIDVTVALSFSVFDKPFYSATVRIKCDNVLDPTGCTFEPVGTPTAAALAWFRPRCDWGCFARCAPECITCGTSYYCWAACAARCIWKCCTIF